MSAAAARTDLAVLGDCNVDLLLSGGDVVPAFGQAEQIVDAAAITIGGSAGIVAAGAARLGLSCRLVSVVGDDELARIQLAALRRRGVDVSCVRSDPTRPTGLSVILARGADRAILTALGTIDALRDEHVDRAALREARHVHVASYYLLHGLRPALPGLLAELRSAGVTTSLDTNWDPSGGWDGGLETLLEHVDCLLPNGEEALRISGERSVERAAAALARRVGTVAVKLGADGALAQRGDEVVRRGSLAVDAIDATGAGDGFDAGFIAGELAGWPLERTLGLACACGALSTRALGGVDAQPTLDEALRALAAHDQPPREGPGAA